MKFYLLFIFFTIFSFTSFQSQTIMGDNNSDGCVNLDDILNVLSTYGQCLDECGVPNGGNLTCLDECGVPNGDNSTCLDECGVPNGDNSSCLDECGVPNGDNSMCLDACGVPNGDNSSCTDCFDVLNGDGLVTHEGYDYFTVLIGNQCWFSENCRYLPEVSPSSATSVTEPYYYVYGYQGTDITAAKSSENYETYGVLYNWPAVTTEGICPSGWHIASDEDFTQLTDYLGGEAVAGYAMKSADGWNGSDSSGFNCLPAGNSAPGGYFLNIDDFTFLWCASETTVDKAWSRHLTPSYDYVSRADYLHSFGFSARCVRD